MENLVERGFALIQQWYPHQVRRLGLFGKSAVVRDRLWDRMVDGLLSAVRSYSGLAPFDVYLGVCMKRARFGVMRWAGRRNRLITDGLYDEGNLLDRRQGREREVREAFEDVASKMSRDELDMVYPWAERTGTVAGAMNERKAFSSRFHYVLKRLRSQCANA